MHQHSASCTHHTASISQLSQQASKVKLLVTVLVLICSFALAELAVGLFSHSLALLADSGHMVSDCFALILALLATWLSQRRRASELEPDNHWFEVLAALVMGWD
ncbi:MAG: cation transporter [Microcoleus sp. SIO2G3]|nr:cation transporter [Microcoleus sp. SIO2G3]